MPTVKNPAFIGDNRLRWLKSKQHPGYPLPKWLIFIELCMDMRLRVALYPAKSTRSKYVHLNLGAKRLKVRFSEHKPTKHNDARLFVGLDKKGRRRSTVAALNYVIKYFTLKEPGFKKLPPIT